MPPKKKDKKATGEIVNMYERMPKRFLDNVENPNFHLHNLKIPLRACIVAPSGSGKSNLLVNILSLFCDGDGTFADMTIITRNKDEPLYRFKIPKIIRNNCSYMILLKLSGQREVNIILSEFGLGVTKEQLIELYEYATAEKFSPLIIDLEADKEQRFRKGLKEIISV